MAEDKGLLASAIESVNLMSINGNGVHDDDLSSASGSPGSENANGQDSKVEASEFSAKAAGEGSDSAQSQRVVSFCLPVTRTPAMSEFRLYPLLYRLLSRREAWPALCCMSLSCL